MPTLRRIAQAGLAVLLAAVAYTLLAGFCRTQAARPPDSDPAPLVSLNRPVGQPTAPGRRNLSPPSPYSLYLPLVQKLPMVEARALWVTRWDYSSAADVQRIAQKAAQAGFNILLFQVRGTADAFYTPGLEPWAARLSGALGQDPGWDPLQTAIEAAHAHGLELHAYINVYPVWSGTTPPPTSARPQHLFWTLSYRYTWDDWRAVDRNGVTMTLNSGYLWPSPALTDVVERAISVSVDLATRYGVDGIHLDLVRYPGREYSYDPFSNAGFAAARQIEPELTREEWQRRQVTQLVSRTYSALLSVNPRVRLSAAVWPVYIDRWGWGYSQGYSDYYQDSQGWLLNGALDTIAPMIYPARVDTATQVFTPAQFALLVSDFLAHDGGRDVWPGITAQYTDFQEIERRIASARALGAPGHAIFCARYVERNDYWDEFAQGPYRLAAVVPPMPWRANGRSPQE